MKVATKLGAAFALHTCLLTSLIVYHVRTTRNAVATGRELSEISSRIHATSTLQLARLAQLQETAEKYAVTHDPGYLDRFRELTSSHDEELNQLHALSLSAPERSQLDSLNAEWQRFTMFALRLHGRGTVTARTMDRELVNLEQSIDLVRLHTQRLGEASQSVMTARLDNAALSARSAERVSWWAAGIALVLSVLISAFIVRAISEPLRRLTEGTRAVAEGRFDYRLDNRRGDEFAQLAGDFNRMTMRLAELDQMKRDFLSKVSHDLKTPLASVRETTAALLDGIPGPVNERQRRLLELNQQSASRLASMVIKLLDMARFESGLGLQRQVVDPVAIAGNSAEHASLANFEREVRITLDAPAEKVALDCDVECVHRLFENLLENATKFSPPGATVEVRMRTLTARPPDIPDDMWPPVAAGVEPSRLALHVAVADRGPGVADADKQRIFERFYQTDLGRGVRNRGVGLGLTICRETVAAHGGSIWVGDNAGGGSIFNVLLPRALHVVTPEPLAPIAASERVI